jgi:hypothetical protein
MEWMVDNCPGSEQIAGVLEAVNSASAVIKGLRLADEPQESIAS